MALTYIVPVRYCINRGSANGAPAGGAFLVDIPSRWKPRTKQQPTGLLVALPLMRQSRLVRVPLGYPRQLKKSADAKHQRIFGGVPSGTRTHGLQIHNLAR